MLASKLYIFLTLQRNTLHLIEPLEVTAHLPNLSVKLLV